MASGVPLLAPVLSPVGAEAALVARTGQAVAGRAALPTAAVAAVVLSAIVPSAYEEARRAPGAAQVVEKNAGVHPQVRVDRNWTGASGSARVRAYGPSAACTEGVGLQPGPLILSTCSPVVRHAPWWGEFRDGSRLVSGAAANVVLSHLVMGWPWTMALVS